MSGCCWFSCSGWETGSYFSYPTLLHESNGYMFIFLADLYMIIRCFAKFNHSAVSWNWRNQMCIPNIDPQYWPSLAMPSKENPTTKAIITKSLIFIDLDLWILHGFVHSLLSLSNYDVEAHISMDLCVLKFSYSTSFVVHRAENRFLVCPVEMLLAWILFTHAKRAIYIMI
jgi:hypothetical protein